MKRGNDGLWRVCVHEFCAIRAGDGRLEGGEASRGNLGKQEIGLAITKYFLQSEPVVVDDLVGPRLRLKRPVSALDGSAAPGACGLALDGVHDALATEQVVARGGHGVVDVFKTDRALQFLLERFDIRLHLRVKLLFAPGVNDHRARSLQRARRCC